MTPNNTFEADRDTSWPHRARYGLRARASAEWASCPLLNSVVGHRDMDRVLLTFRRPPNADFLALYDATLIWSLTAAFMRRHLRFAQ